jgi:transposase
MLLIEGNGIAIGLHVDSARPNELKLVEATLESVRVPRPQGRPRQRPVALAADKLFDSQALRRSLRRRGIQPHIPTVARPHRKSPKRGRPLRVGPIFRNRWKVERTFAWLKNCRRLVIRYERAIHRYRAFCLLALILFSVRLILK